jgi:NADPH2:quinone reductase
MKTIEVTKNGGPDVLQVVEGPRPEPGPGQILIEVKAAGINFADLMSRAGTYPMAPAPPFVPGFEAAGVIAAVGPDVTHLAPGARVMASMRGGGYAEYVLAEAAQTVPLPDALDFAPATALLAQGLTAYFLLHRSAQIRPGQSVLVSAAAGGVGSLAVQMAKLLGAGTVIGLASTDAKRALVKDLGADEAVDYTQDGWPAQVKAATGGRGADIYLDATGDTAHGLDALAPEGSWVIYGSQQGQMAGLDGDALTRLLFGGQALRGFSMHNVFPDAQAIQDALRQQFAWVSEGRLRIESGGRFPLADAAEAHRAIEARRTTGKVVLEP